MMVTVSVETPVGLADEVQAQLRDLQDGVDAATEAVDAVWDQVDALQLPSRILMREERRFRGQLAFYAGDWERAIATFTAALERMPVRGQLGNTQRARTHFQLGVALFEAGESGQAEENLLRVIEEPSRVYDPLSAVRAHWYLGQVYEARGDDAGAREHYQRFVDFWESGDIDEQRVAYAEDFVDR